MLNRKEKILKNIEERMNLKVQDYDAESFLEHAKIYVSAIKDGRMIVNIGSVSRSGMSRTMKFLACVGKKGSYRYYNFLNMFKALGYTFRKDFDYFSVSGCGMDMVFATNYNIIHTFHKLGIITKKQCEILSQKTPHTI